MIEWPVAIDTDPAHLLRRSLLLGAPETPDIHDQIDCAGICLSCGLREPARLLYEVAFIRQGFSVDHLAQQARVAALTGLWDATPAAPPSSLPAAGTMAVALDELRCLAASFAEPARVPATGGEDSSEPESMLGRVQPMRATESLRGVGELAHRLYMFLHGPACPDDRDDVQQLMSRLQDAGRQQPGFDHVIYADAPLPTLVSAVALAGLHEFLLANRDLAFGEFGSAQLLHAAARLSIEGLGPYLSNVGLLVRDSRDVFDLARVAAAAHRADGAAAGPGLGPWVALLARSLTGDLLERVVDDLAGLGATSALRMIYDRVAARRADAIQPGLVRRLRDAALDNGDHGLAALAQELIVSLHPDQPAECLMLGEIQASAGQLAAAERTLLKHSQIAPDPADALRRLRILRAGDPDASRSPRDAVPPRSGGRARSRRPQASPARDDRGRSA